MRLQTGSVALLATTASGHLVVTISPPANIVTKVVHGTFDFTFSKCGKFLRSVQKHASGDGPFVVFNEIRSAWALHLRAVSCSPLRVDKMKTANRTPIAITLLLLFGLVFLGIVRAQDEVK